MDDRGPSRCKPGHIHKANARGVISTVPGARSPSELPSFSSSTNANVSKWPAIPTSSLAADLQHRTHDFPGMLITHQATPVGQFHPAKLDKGHDLVDRAPERRVRTDFEHHIDAAPAWVVCLAQHHLYEGVDELHRLYKAANLVVGFRNLLGIGNAAARGS
ncbi:hypothetical protein BDW75DRAFT_242148 [Aspergillus navahoensis]